MKMEKIFLVTTLVIILILSVSCDTDKKEEYKIIVSGEVKESGVIAYLGYEMNVYKDLASNPCGTCADQPISVYVGVSAEDIVDAIGKAIIRADDIWTVEEQSGNEITLIEKEAGTADKTEKPTAPKGLTIEGEVL